MDSLKPQAQCAPSGGAGAGGNPAGGVLPRGDPPIAIQGVAIPIHPRISLQLEPLPNSQSGGAGQLGGQPGAPAGHPSGPHAPRPTNPWTPLDRSRKALPQFKLLSNYKSRRILDTRQMLEDWYNKSTLAIATWRGDAQKYWPDQVLKPARLRHEQWLQSTPDRRASPEPAYILGDHKLTPEAANAVESVLRTELLDAIPKPMAEACVRQGCCAVELIIWRIVQQLILPPDRCQRSDSAEGDPNLAESPSIHPGSGVQVARRNAA